MADRPHPPHWSVGTDTFNGGLWTVEWDHHADWDKHWLAVLTTPAGVRTVYRRCISYFEALQSVKPFTAPQATPAVTDKESPAVPKIKPWTFESMDIYHQETWEIYHPELGRPVATFYDKDEAQDYLDWANKRQAKRQAKKAKRQAEGSRATAWTRTEHA